MPKPTSPDKVIVTHKAAMKAKYAAGAAAIDSAVKRLIVADQARGLMTIDVDLSSPVHARKYGFKAIPLAVVLDAKKHKEAIDTIVLKLQNPAYLMLLGSVDLIPHVPLVNPLYSPNEDPDETADSDLPYACTAKYSTDPAKFITPSRVVGRLPDLTGGTDPAYLVGLLDLAAGYKPRDREKYDPYLGLSAEVWKGSTAQSLDLAFGNHADLQLSPPIDFPAVAVKHLGRLAHFINCHGNTATPRFSGQIGTSYPTALEASQLKGTVGEGTVVAAECCYGAELYDPALGGGMGLCNSYLAEKAYAFFGSSTIAYGPEDDNDLADLICQDFMKHVRAGASIGRACLLARLDYLSRRSGRLTPHDLKTLAQFHLMGDPALTPVKPVSPHSLAKTMSIAQPKGLAGIAASAATRFVLERFNRTARRDWLLRYSDAMATVADVFAEVVGGVGPSRKTGKPAVGSVVSKAIQDLAIKMGMKSPTIREFSQPASAPVKKVAASKMAKFKLANSSTDVRLHLVMERIEDDENKNTVLIRGFEAIESEGVLTVRKFVSR
jgi:hypothetical protein